MGRGASVQVTQEKNSIKIPFKPKVPLWKHQLEAVIRSIGKNYYALFFDPGTGKTATTINMLRIKYLQNGGLFPTLIICPLIVMRNWEREIQMHSNIPPERIVCLRGDKRFKRKLVKEAHPDSVFIVNYDSLNTESFEIIEEKLLDSKAAGRPLATVLDESHRIKSIKAKRTARATALMDMSQYKFLLTGTPILNKLEDIFSQWRALDAGKAFGRNFWTFRKVFFFDKNAAMPRDRYFPDWRPKPDSVERIKSMIKPFVSYAKKEECLDLPPLLRQTIEVGMSVEQGRLYREMKEDLVATIKHGEIFKASIAELAITKALRLQQIVSGHIRVEEGDGTISTVRIPDNPRRMALRELLDGLVEGHKVIVWAVFKSNFQDIRDVCDDLKVQYAELHGDTKDKQGEVDKFNTDPECRVMIGHPGAGGIGVNLIAASYAVFYSRSFSLEYDLQAEARNHRGGSEIHEKITRIDLVTPGTIDEVCLKALASKQQLSDKLLLSEIESL